MERVFEFGKVILTYTHVDCMIFGGVTLMDASLKLLQIRHQFI